MKWTDHTLSAVVAVSLGLLAFAPAIAASDYLLELDSVEGEVTTKTTVELASWSFGASNPTSVGSSSMATGRPVGQPSAAGLGTTIIRGGHRHAPPAQNGQVSMVASPEAMTGMASGRSACAAGKHFPTATLYGGGKRWALTDVTISTCASDGMTLSYRSVTGYDLKTSKK